MHSSNLGGTQVQLRVTCENVTRGAITCGTRACEFILSTTTNIRPPTPTLFDDARATPRNIPALSILDSGLYHIPPWSPQDL